MFCVERDFKVCEDLVPISKQDLGTNKGSQPALTASACPAAPLPGDFPSMEPKSAGEGREWSMCITRWDGADQRASAGAG